MPLLFRNSGVSPAGAQPLAFGDRVNPALRHRRNALALQELGRQPGGRPTARIQAVKLAGPRLIDDHEQVAADAVGHRSEDPHRRVGRHGGVHGVAAFGQDRRADLRRQRVLGRGDALTCDDHRAGL
jgi:hypothetical protein